MLRFRIITLFLLSVWILTACAPGMGTGTITAVPPTPYEDKILPPAAVVAAQEQLAAQLGIAPDAISIPVINEKEWPDSCLGAGGPAESCALVVTKGYEVIFEAGGKSYAYRVSQDGSQVRPEPEQGGAGVEAPQSGGQEQPAVQRALEILSQELGVSIDRLVVETVEPVDWPNSCLGVERPEMSCLMAITPGYRIVVSFDGAQYVLHTDEMGSHVILAESPAAEIESTVLAWELREGSACSSLEIGEQGAAAGTCSGPMEWEELSAERQNELQEMLETYAPFEAETPAGTITFVGQGSHKASAAGQRSAAEWARLVQMEMESGRSGAAWGVVFSWHREGGIAGLCDDLVVYASGWASASTCKGSPRSLGAYRLTDQELADLYEFADSAASFEYQQKDAAAADSMTVRMTFTGNGKKQPSADAQEQIAAFAAGLFAQSSR